MKESWFTTERIGRIQRNGWIAISTIITLLLLDIFRVVNLDGISYFIVPVLVAYLILHGGIAEVLNRKKPKPPKCPKCGIRLNKFKKECRHCGKVDPKNKKNRNRTVKY